MMASMRFQFSTRQILLITAFVAIICGGTLAFRQTSKQWIRNGFFACLFDGQSLPWPYVAFYAAVPAPLWTPVVFVAYAIGRWSFTTRLVVIFAVIEVVAIFMSWGAWRWLHHRESMPWPEVAFYAAVPAPLWTPVVFVAYLIGRRSFTTRLVVIFAVIEVVAIFISWGAFQLRMWFDGMW